MDKYQLTEQAARVIGLSGEFRQVGDERVYVLDKASAAKWGGQYLFAPMDISDDAFTLAGVLSMGITFASCYASARKSAGVFALELYNAYPKNDRFAAMRAAVVKCAIKTTGDNKNEQQRQHLCNGG